MPNQISQIQVGSTTYDICDATARSFSNLQKITIYNAAISSVSWPLRVRFLLSQIQDFSDTAWKILSISDIYISDTNAVPQSWRIFASGRGFYVYFLDVGQTGSLAQKAIRINLILTENSTNGLILPPSDDDTSRSYILTPTEDSET